MDFTKKEYYAKALGGMSNIAKTYVRISTLKSALTVFLVGYTALKAAQMLKTNKQ